MKNFTIEMEIKTHDGDSTSTSTMDFEVTCDRFAVIDRYTVMINGAGITMPNRIVRVIDTTGNGYRTIYQA